MIASMSGRDLEQTVDTFPSYAALTQTQGWSTPSGVVRADAHGTIDALEASHGSRYTEGAVLGRGGMGKVVLASDARLGRSVAMKILHPERELDPLERKRFVREAQVQGQLEHPAIVPVYDIERLADGTTCFTMRRVLGHTLSTIVADLRSGVPAVQSRYTQRELLTRFATVCLAIDYAHSRGVIHRDLKPANIMFGDFGEVYVLDWGLARLVDDSGTSVDEPASRLSMPGSFLGTPLYVAPEQMADPDVGPRADVYSLGLMLFELLTLQCARDPNAIYMPVDARTSVRAPARGVAPELETICIKATEADPQDRFASARELQEAIARYLEGDRELEQRRALATEHVRAARAALERAERGLAVTELGRAVALDPSNQENFSMLGELVATPPSTIPTEVREDLARDDQRVLHLGVRFGATAMLSWFAFVPLLWVIGLADAAQLAWIGVPALLAFLANVAMVRTAEIGPRLQYATIVFMLLACVMSSRLYGVFVMVPVMVTTFAIVMQTHPHRPLRITAFVGSALALAIPAILEWQGVVPATYRFEHGTWITMPQIMELPRTGTFVFLVIAYLAMMIGPAILIARLRADLSRAQTRLAVQAWHFRQLGTHLIGRPE